MIKRENLKQAIDAISSRDSDIGYSLERMFGRGQIDVPSHPDKAFQEDDLYFLFQNQKVTVNKILYFTEGTVPIEQHLLIKYGELVKEQELQYKEDLISYPNSAAEIRAAGFKFMVTHEIDYAIARLKKKLQKLGVDPDHPPNISFSGESSPAPLKNGTNIAFYKGLICFLEDIKQDNPARKIPEEAFDPNVLYRGTVDVDTLAFFAYFPCCIDSLIQIAEINLEFFHVRFILNYLARGLEKNLFVCVVKQKIVGLVYLVFKDHLFGKVLEIKFIATLGGKTGNRVEAAPAAVKGAGVLLVAGVWMLWKTYFARVDEIRLDSEIGARGFYASIGFQTRGISEYVLKSPEGHLVKAILVMANHCRDPKKNVVEEIRKIIKKQFKILRKKAGDKKKERTRKLAIASVKVCMQSGAHPKFAETAVEMLMKYKRKIPESEELVQFTLKYGSDATKAYLSHAATTCH